MGSWNTSLLSAQVWEHNCHSVWKPGLFGWARRSSCHDLDCGWICWAYRQRWWAPGEFPWGLSWWKHPGLMFLSLFCTSILVCIQYIFCIKQWSDSVSAASLLSGPVDSADSHSEAVPEEALRNSGAGSASAQSGHSGEMEMCLGIIN